MKRIFNLFFTIPLFLMPACAKPGTVNERELKIRYVNMGILFEYVVKSDTGSSAIVRQKEQQVQRIRNIEKEILSAQDAGRKSMLLRDLENSRAEMERLQAQEELLKQKAYDEIRRALSSVAKRQRIDYIYNTGDCLVYAVQDYDVTETVLREIITRRKRNAPVSR